MSSEGPAANGDVRQVLREVLAELLPQMVDGAVQRHAAPASPADDAPVPQVPAPPVAAVHRPSTWTGDGEAAAAPTAPARRADGRATVEEVSIETDADLDAFARRLLRLFENPRDRQALRSGRLRFALRRRGAQPGAPAPVFRVEKRAVTERVVDEAAAAGMRVVLGPGAVLTPLARDRAKKLGVEIEREK